MKYLSDRYVKVMEYKGYAICTLKIANPANGDELGYVIDDDVFSGEVYNLLDDAVASIDNSN